MRVVAPILGRAGTKHSHRLRRFGDNAALNMHLVKRSPAKTVTPTCSLKTDKPPYSTGPAGVAGTGVGLRLCVAQRHVGWRLTEPPSLLFSAGVSFSFKVLVSGGAACVLEEAPWDDLFSVSVFTSASASC